MTTMCAAALRGDALQAERVDAALQALHSGLFVESNPIPVKWALSQMGLMDDALRLPLTPLAAANHAVVRSAMRQAKIQLKNNL